eukprot:251022-Rhodomonas_salina.1
MSVGRHSPSGAEGRKVTWAEGEGEGAQDRVPGTRAHNSARTQQLVRVAPSRNVLQGHARRGRRRAREARQHDLRRVRGQEVDVGHEGDRELVGRAGRGRGLRHVADEEARGEKDERVRAGGDADQVGAWETRRRQQRLGLEPSAAPKRRERASERERELPGVSTATGGRALAPASWTEMAGADCCGVLALVMLKEST